MSDADNIIQTEELRDREGVFHDREHAGQVLAGMVRDHVSPRALVLAVPAGGVPVGVVLARELGLPLDVAVVSKITPPWNTEAGYGAVAFDGSVLLNQPLARQMGLEDRVVQSGIDLARRKVERRLEILRRNRPPLAPQGRTILLVDDGLATGCTLMAACTALRGASAAKIILAVPTAHTRSLQIAAERFNRIYCPNVRGGAAFAVASAYRNWDDVGEDQARDLLAAHWAQHETSAPGQPARSPPK